jgi:hypothetical protein
MGTKISELPATSVKSLTSVLPIVVSGVTDQIELGALLGADRTGLTGGGSSNLDGVVTVGQGVGQLWNVVVGGDKVYHYQLQAGTSSENSPFVIRPDDYASSTNEKIFVLLGIYGVTVKTNQTVIGVEAAPLLTTGGDNTVIGRRAGKVMINSNQNNVLVGAYAGYTLDAASNNTFVGYRAGLNNTNGSKNVCIGYGAGKRGGAGVGGFHDSVCIGYDAGKGLNYQSHGAVVIGFRAGGQQGTTGDGWEMGEDVFIGMQAGSGATYTFQNNLVGWSSAGSGTVFNNNNFFGCFTGQDLSTGCFNCFFGDKAGRSNTTGELNSFFGADAGRLVTTGRRNSAFGAHTNNVAGDNTSGALILGYGARALNDNEFSVGSSTVPLNTTTAGGIIPATAEKFLMLRVNGELFMVPLLRVFDSGRLTLAGLAPTLVV